jgi:hypothetical protein
LGGQWKRRGLNTGKVLLQLERLTSGLGPKTLGAASLGGQWKRRGLNAGKVLP